MSKALVILSGGMDSSVLLHYIADLNKSVSAFAANPREVYAITFNYGQRISREIECAKFQAAACNVKEHKIVNLDFFKDISQMSALTNTDLKIPKARDDIGNAQPLSYVPFRNLLMLSTAASWAETIGASTLCYGAVQTDDYSGYWDCTTLFLESVNKVFNLNRKNPISIIAPFIKFEKNQVVKLGLDLKVDFKQTHTCYEGHELACGECVSCAARIKAFIDNKTVDPLRYSKEIPWSKYNCSEVTYL